MTTNNISSDDKNTTTTTTEPKPFKIIGNAKYVEDCTVCKAVSGTILMAAGLYTFFSRHQFPQAKQWMGFVGGTTFTFGLGWALSGQVSKFTNRPNQQQIVSDSTSSSSPKN
eukprot:gene2200-2713_t